MSVDTGTIVEGTVVKITNYGAFVELPDGRSGLVHIREIADTYVKDVRDYLKEQEKVKVKVLGLNERGKLDLSVKQALSRSEEHTSELQSPYDLVCRLLLEKKKRRRRQRNKRPRADEGAICCASYSK